jgi:PAS domain S-box-containing protein
MGMERILIVEDKKVTAKHLQATLTDYGHEAKWIASNAEEAVKLALEIKPDLVLMDIMLEGGMDGIEAAERIRSDMDLPIIYLTAYADEAMLKRAKITDPSGYLLKPFRAEELKTSIEIVLHKHRIERRVHEELEDRVNQATAELVEANKALKLEIVEREMAEEAERDKVEQLTAINSLAREIASNLSRSGVMSEACKAIRSALSPDLAVIFLADGDLLNHQNVESRNETAAIDEAMAKRFGEYLYEVTAASGEPIVCADAGTDQFCAREECKNARIASFAAVPLVHDDTVMGVLGVASRTEHDFSAYVDFLATLGSQVAIGLKNAGLFEQSQRYARELEREIAEHKEAEVAVRAAERKYRYLFDDSRDGIYMTSRAGDVLTANTSFLEMFGYTEEEMMKTNVLDIYADPNDRENFQKAIENAGYVKDYAIRFRRSDGRKLDCLVTASLRSGEDKSILGYQGIIRDITERVEAEQALQRSRQKYQELVELLPVIVFQLDAQGKFTFLNRAGFDQFGHTEEDKGKVSLRDMLLPEDVDWTLADFIKVLQGAYLNGVEYTLLNKDRTPCSLLASLVPIKHEHAIVGVRGVAIDITERKRTQEALRKTERRFKHFLEDMVDVAYETDSSGKVTYANRAIETISGLSLKDVIGSPFPKLFGQESREAALELLQKTEKGTGPEGELTLANGKIFHFKNQPLIDENGKNIGVFGTARDVTERVEAERALRKSEEKYRLLVDNAPIGILSIDSKGKILDVNRKLLEILGSPSLEETKSINILTFPALVESGISDVFKSCVLEQQVVHAEKPYTSTWGKTSHLRILVTPMGESESNLEGYQAVVEDISVNKSLEDQLRQSQKLEAIATLAGGMAHDLNNLLQVVLGSADLLLLKKSSADPDVKSLESIVRAAQNGGELIQSILTFSKSTGSKRRHVDLSEEVHRVESLLRRTIPKMIQIDIRMAEFLWKIHADPTQIEQVLLNLAVNAKDAMPEGGTLLIETKNVKLREDYCRNHVDAQPGEYVLLQISDSGNGMKKEVMERIYEPFYTTKEAGKGTGLGLAMVYGIVRNHGGSIHCSSEPGVGTTFKIYLPVTKLDLITDVAETLEMPVFGNETILLVDDEKMVREVGEQMLTWGGYRVLTASNGTEALWLYNNNRTEISLVILDLVMPEMGGKECLEALLSIDPEVKVLIASGYSGNGPSKALIENGAKASIDKPFDTKPLLLAIRQVLDGD